MWRSFLGGFLVVALGVAGCGTTRIVTSDPTARIFVDGQLLGRGLGELTRRGAPGTTTVTAKTDDGRQEQTTIKRRFTEWTFLGGLFTYGICFVFCWEYPDTVLVSLPAPAHQGPQGGEPPSGGFGAPPQGGAVDPWLVAPPGWQPRTAPATTAPPTPRPPPAAIAPARSG
jgi:hypothetical protein